MLYIMVRDEIVQAKRVRTRKKARNQNYLAWPRNQFGTRVNVFMFSAIT